MSWDMLPTFRLQITQYSMEDIGIHGDFPTFTLKNHPDFHNNGGAGLVYHLSSFTCCSRVLFNPLYFFINLPMGKDGKRTSTDFHLPCSIPDFAIPTISQLQISLRPKELGGKLMPHPRHDVCSGAGIQVTQNVLDDFLVSNDGNWELLSLFNGKRMGNAWELIGTYGKMWGNTL